MNSLKVVIISPWKTTWPFIWTNLNPLHPSICFVPNCVNGIGSAEKDFFFNFSVTSPWKVARPFISLTFKDNLCQVRLKLSQWFWWRFLNVKTFSTVILLGKRRGSSFQLTNTHYLNMHSDKFGWKWRSGSGKNDKLSIIYIFAIISPWKRVWPIINLIKIRSFDPLP